MDCDDSRTWQNRPCFCTISRISTVISGWWFFANPLKNMGSSVGMMTSHILWKIYWLLLIIGGLIIPYLLVVWLFPINGNIKKYSKHFQTTNQISVTLQCAHMPLRWHNDASCSMLTIQGSFFSTSVNIRFLALFHPYSLPQQSDVSPLKMPLWYWHAFAVLVNPQNVQFHLRKLRLTPFVRLQWNLPGQKTSMSKIINWYHNHRYFQSNYPIIICFDWTRTKWYHIIIYVY